MDKPDKPLAGKRIVVTRALDQARELSVALENIGAEVVSFPTVAFAPPDDWQQLDQQLRRLDSFDAILFLSRNAVRFIFDRCAELGIQCERAGPPARLVAAVGPATAAALKHAGVRVDYIAKQNDGEALVRELRDALAGRRVLLPRSDRGDERVPDALREIGAGVTEVVAYRTVEPSNLDPAILDRIRRAEVDAVVFSSPSAFRSFRRLLGEAETRKLSARIPFFAIGPTTARAISDSGMQAPVHAPRASSAGLVQAIVDYYRQPSFSARGS